MAVCICPLCVLSINTTFSKGLQYINNINLSVISVVYFMQSNDKEVFPCAFFRFPPHTAICDIRGMIVGEEREGGGVLVRGELMSDSRAAGCLVVLQGPPTSPDIFRALQRTQSGDTVSTTIPLPPSNYTVYGCDLEENGLPNTMPAVILDTEVTTFFTGS